MRWKPSPPALRSFPTGRRSFKRQLHPCGFLLNIVLYRPIRNILIQRKEKIEGLEQDIQNATTILPRKKPPTHPASAKPAKKGCWKRTPWSMRQPMKKKKIIDKINADALAELNAVKAKVAQEAEAGKGRLC
jgi:F-type H+-transporting ATPase subunit b